MSTFAKKYLLAAIVLALPLTLTGFKQRSIFFGQNYSPLPPSCTSGACSDTFTGTATTLLFVHDSHWGDFGNVGPTSYSVASCALNGSNTVSGTTTSSACGAIYTTSTSPISNIVMNPFLDDGSLKTVSARVSNGTNNGYEAGFCCSSGGNWQDIAVFKNGLAGGPSNTWYITGTWAMASTWKMGIETIGTTAPVTINIYINNSLVGTFSDTSSIITGGHPGFRTLGAGDSLTVNSMGKWCDFITAC